jgi:hypothetical protein
MAQHDLLPFNGTAAAGRSMLSRPSDRMQSVSVSIARGSIDRSATVTQPGDEVLGEALWRRRAERGPPEGAKIVEAERADAVDLGLDGFAIG